MILTSFSNVSSLLLSKLFPQWNNPFARSLKKWGIFTSLSLPKRVTLVKTAFSLYFLQCSNSWGSFLPCIEWTSYGQMALILLIFCKILKNLQLLGIYMSFVGDVICFVWFNWDIICLYGCDGFKFCESPECLLWNGWLNQSINQSYFPLHSKMSWK